MKKAVHEFRELLLSEECGEEMKNMPQALSRALRDLGATVRKGTIELTYENASVEEALQMLLYGINPFTGRGSSQQDDEQPQAHAAAAVSVPTAFETAGHLAHFNLRDEIRPYGPFMGRIVLDKLPHIRTVVNKFSAIENEFRTCPLELLAGENTTQVEVRESGARFRFDFANVYWNSRLQTEHARIIACVPKGAIVCDVMAGVGPFAVPLAMKGCTVHANDLNPASVQSLRENAELNNVTRRITTFNQDGREFVRRTVRDRVFGQHFIMNLPHMALEFLDAFRGLYAGLPADAMPAEMPTIHVYCFSKSSDPKQDACERASLVLGHRITPESPSMVAHIVRDVAPRTYMICLSFRLPVEVALAEQSPMQEFKRTRSEAGAAAAAEESAR